MPNVMLNYGPNGGRRLGRHFEETIRGGTNRSIKALLVTDVNDDDNDI